MTTPTTLQDADTATGTGSLPSAPPFAAALRRRRLSRVFTPWDFRETARRMLPRMVFDYIDGGTGDDGGVRANHTAIERVALVSDTPADVTSRDSSVELFGRTYSMPVIVGPTGLASASWPEGEISFARAAARHRVPFVLSGSGSTDPRRVAKAGDGHVWFQLYAPPNIELVRQWVKYASEAGFTAMEVTVDVAVAGLRLRDARNGFVMPFRWSPGKFLDVASRPAWAMKMLYYGQPTPFLAVDRPPGQPAPRNQTENRRHRYTTALSWDLLKLLRDEWRGPLIIKGLMNPRQGTNAVEAGFDGIVISNHGGRQLEGALSPMEILPEFSAEVGKRIPLLIDGGFRSGTDVLKAIALGASAVQIGRAGVFALATAGDMGVDHLLNLFKAEIDTGMALCGVTSLSQLGPHSVRMRTF